MRLSIIRKNGSKSEKSLILQGKQIALQAPESGDPLMLEAEFDEGSPIKIVVSNGSQREIPVRRLRLVHKETYWVKGFTRETKAGTVKVSGHERRKPYVKMRDKHASI